MADAATRCPRPCWRRLSEVARLALLLGFAKLWPRPTVELYAMDQRIKTLRHEINIGKIVLIP